jgi:hypothetical protein
MAFVRSEGEAAVAILFSFMGTLLIVEHSKWGFLLHMICSALWVVFGWRRGLRVIMLSETLYFLLHLRGLLTW